MWGWRWLATFPDIYKEKCWNGLSSPSPPPKAGGINGGIATPNILLLNFLFGDKEEL